MRKHWEYMVVGILCACMLAGCDVHTESGLPTETDTLTQDVSQIETQSGTQENTQQKTQQDTQEETTDDVSTEAETMVPPEPVVETLTVTATGDCALGALQTHGYSKSFHQFYDKYGESYFFEKFRDIFQQDDLTIINLECVFTDETKRVEKKFNIKGHPHYTGILTSSFVEACSLANNHTRDYGEASFEDTKQALDAAGVSYSYEDVVAYYETESGIRVAMLSAHLLSDKEAKEPILMAALEKARQEADLVIVSCHWGVEQKHELNAYQKKTAHKLIDAGADLIIGNHPHVLQGIEYYKGKIICYSLGNFSFGANRNPADKNTAVFQQTFTFVDGVLTTELDARVIPTRLSGKNNSNNYQPVIATGTQAETILKNLRNYSASLSKLEMDEQGRLIINE